MNFPSPAFRCDSTDPELVTRFLRELVITELDIELGYLTLEDGSEWKLYLEGEALIRYVKFREDFQDLRLPCLCSFQLWGKSEERDYRVICRKLTPKVV